MNLDELRSVQNKERRKDSLQRLRDSFYEDVGQYVADLKAQRDRAAEEADDPFSNPEVGRLTDEIETAEEVVEAVYERRMGKIVKRASFAAAGMPSDEEGLTTEEKELFADIVDRIEANKGRVLDVLAGEDAASGDAEPAPDDPTPDPSTADDGGVSAADLMGDDPDVADGASDPESPPEPGNGVPDPVAEAERQRASADGPDEADPGAVDADPSDARTPADAPTASGPAVAPDPAGTADTDAPGRDSAGDETVADGEWVGEGASSAGPADAAASEVAADTDRVTVRITQDVGQILGVDEREYDLTAEDVVTLPEQNVEPLVQRDAAKRLD